MIRFVLTVGEVEYGEFGRVVVPNYGLLFEVGQALDGFTCEMVDFVCLLHDVGV